MQNVYFILQVLSVGPLWIIHTHLSSLSGLDLFFFCCNYFLIRCFNDYDSIDALKIKTSAAGIVKNTVHSFCDVHSM